MKVRHLQIRNFRGIHKLDWLVPQTPTICFIGPGDSTKSTILDAMEYVLWPHWNLQFLDTDFYKCNTSEPIEITITVGEIPESLLPYAKYGYHLRGCSLRDGVQDEPWNNTEPVISVQLTVTGDLEPCWSVFTERGTGSECVRISARDREALGIARVDPYLQKHFSWSRGSALIRLTDKLEDVPKVLANANREVRRQIAAAELSELRDAARRAGEVAKKFGVNPAAGGYKPALDARSGSIGIGWLALHDGEIPARQAGLGSQRLLAFAIQQASVPEGAILLIDEVEYGLEPYRLRHLIREVRLAEKEQPSIDTLPSGKLSGGQVFMTTHSPVVITELSHDELFVVRSQDGTTHIQPVHKKVKAVTRQVAEALLGRKILVCEGDTEYGVVQVLDSTWAKESDGYSFAYCGVVAVVPRQGGGSNAPKFADKLAQLGYDVALLGDSDRSLSPNLAGLQAAGVRVILWAGNCALEERVCQDLPWSSIQTLLDLALQEKGEARVRDKVSACLGCPNLQSVQIDDWLKQEPDDEKRIREAIGKAAKEGEWFKSIEMGRELGKLIACDLPAIPDTDLAQKLQELKDWAYDI